MCVVALTLEHASLSQIVSFVDQSEVTKKDLIFDPCSARLKTSLLQTEINVHLYPGIELELT